MGRKGKGKKKDREPKDHLTPLDYQNLQTMLHTYREKTLDVKTKRNYTQMEKDMIDKFYANSDQQLKVLDKKMVLLDGDMQKMEDENQRMIRMFMQKIKHLELEKSKNQGEVKVEAEEAMFNEDEFHVKNIEQLRGQKTELKDVYVKNEDQNQKEVDKRTERNRRYEENKKNTYIQKYQSMESKFKKMLDDLQAKLELKLKVEIHEIEERKNLHINELMKNHDQAYKDLKQFYNQITANNLDLIKAQKEQMKEISNRRAITANEIKSLKKQNEENEEPLRQARQKRRELLKELKQFPKDKLSQANLKIKIVSLKEKLKKMKNEKDDIDTKYAKLSKEKEELVFKFDDVVIEMKKNTQIQDYILGKHVQQLESELLAKEHKLQEIVIGSGLDGHYVNEVTSMVRDTMEVKNSEIRNLQYLIQHATKAYNDAIRVYEEKLVEFGIPPQELGFQTIPSVTSTMPAGLVSS